MEWKIACLLVALLVTSATGYPLFSVRGSRRLPRGDDNSLVQRMRQPFRFYGRSQSYIRIYNNGYVSLGTRATGGYTPRRFPFRGAPMIAPYWADVDTRATGAVYYKSSTSSYDLRRAGSLISSRYCTTFRPTSLYIVTWYRVGAYYRSRSPLNTFQLVLATNTRQSYAMFLYQSVTWTYGRASRGRHARAGLNAGDGRRQVTVPYSGSSAISSIESRLGNVRLRGVNIYCTSGRTVPTRPPRCPATPSNFFPFRSLSVLPRGDDVYRARTVRQPIKMYGRSYRTVYVSNNGYISLNGYTGGYTPRPFPYRSVRPIIAPYWADVDTRSGSGRVYYGETTSSTLRSRAAALVRRIYRVSFSPTHLFIATWHNVGYYNRHTNRLNTFQVVVASDSRQSFIIFNYNRLQWTTGDASGGRRTGFGGTSARAGINGGYGVNAITLYGSGSRSILYKTRDTNCGSNGVFVLAPSHTGTFYPYFGNRALSRSDDGYATTRFSMPFYGRRESVVRVYNNGYMTLRGSGGSYTPRPFRRGNPMIAPYWADVDTRRGGRVYYGATANRNLLKRAKFEVESTQRRIFNPTRIFVATWYNVGYYNRHYNRRNSYQAVMATDGRSTYVLFIYKDIRWTTGDASRGRNGFGGYVARAGINSGVGRYTYIPGSGSQSLMLRLETRTNVRMPGIFILRGSPALAATEIQDSAAVNEEYTVDQSKQENEANMEETLDDNAVNTLTQELDNLAISEVAKNEKVVEEDEKAEVEDKEVEAEEGTEEGMEDEEVEDEEVKDEEVEDEEVKDEEVEDEEVEDDEVKDEEVEDEEVKDEEVEDEEVEDEVKEEGMEEEGMEEGMEGDEMEDEAEKQDVEEEEGDVEDEEYQEVGDDEKLALIEDDEENTEEQGGGGKVQEDGAKEQGGGGKVQGGGGKVQGGGGKVQGGGGKVQGGGGSEEKAEMKVEEVEDEKAEMEGEDAKMEE